MFNKFSFVLCIVIFLGDSNIALAMNMDRDGSLASEKTPFFASSTSYSYVAPSREPLPQASSRASNAPQANPFQKHSFQRPKTSYVPRANDFQNSNFRSEDAMSSCCENMSESCSSGVQSCIRTHIVMFHSMNVLCCVIIGAKVVCGCPC